MGGVGSGAWGQLDGAERGAGAPQDGWAQRCRKAHLGEGRQLPLRACGGAFAFRDPGTRQRPPQLSRQKAWQMARIRAGRLEKKGITNNRSRSFSFRNLQQIGQNGN